MWAPTQQTNYLMHFGVKGMRWGIRRYQNPDGTLTAEGKRHVKAYNTSGEYSKRTKKSKERLDEEGNKLIKKSKGLSRDFGGKHENVDDPEFFEMEARGRKLDTKDYSDAYNEYKKMKYAEKNFNSLNKSSIKKGKKLIEAGFASTPVSELKYYGNSNSFTASNGVKVGAPKNKTVENFRKFASTGAGSAIVKGSAKLNTAFYGGRKGTARRKKWEGFEQQTNKELLAIREAQKAHDEANKKKKDY